MRRGLTVTIVVVLFTVVAMNYTKQGSSGIAGTDAGSNAALSVPASLVGQREFFEQAERPAHPEHLEYLELREPIELDEGIDFYGNRIESAVSAYGLDSSGALYDVHAPQVELPELGRPST